MIHLIESFGLNVFFVISIVFIILTGILILEFSRRKDGREILYLIGMAKVGQENSIFYFHFHCSYFIHNF
jgi:hypothetical protein